MKFATLILIKCAHINMKMYKDQMNLFEKITSHQRWDNHTQIKLQKLIFSHVSRAKMWLIL